MTAGPVTSGMTDIRIQFRRQRSAIVAGFLCVLATVCPADGQFSGPTDRVFAADKPVAQQRNSRSTDDSTLSDSASPLGDRTLQERLRRVRTLMDQRQFDQAVRALRDAASLNTNAMIMTTETPGLREEFHSYYMVMSSVLKVLPEENLAAYRKQVEPLARSQFLLAVRRADAQSLRELILKFPHTPGSIDALHFLMAHHLDRREYAAAASTARRLVQQPNLSSDQRETIFEVIRRCSTELSADHSLWTSPRSMSESASLPGRAGGADLGDDSATGVPLMARLFPVLEHPLWQIHSGLNDETVSLARHALHEHFEQSIPVLPQAQPLVVDDVVIRRSPIQISAHNLSTGRLLWSVNSESDAGQAASRLTMNLSLQELMAQRLARGLQVDSLQSRASSDGERIFTIESGVSNPMFLASPDDGQSSSHIVARDLRTGEVVWSLTSDAFSEAMPNPKQRSPATVYFCGLPIPIDGQIVGLAQTGDLLRLYAAHQTTGKIDWTLDLAVTARNSPSDADWRSLDCRVALVDGMLVCPTGAGLLAGVDLATRSVVWCRRYARADGPLAVTRLPFAPARPQRPWWQGWRNIRLLAARKTAPVAGRDSIPAPAEPILAAASPDADGIHGIDPRSGESIWHQPVSDPIEVLTDNERVVVVSRHSVSAFQASSGSLIWKRPCPEPIGTGYQIRLDESDDVASAFYVFPSRGGALIAVNLDDGTLIRSVDRQESLNGCLSFAGGRVISLTPDRLSVWPLLATQWTPAARSAPTDPESLEPPSTIELAAVERSAGLFERSANRLRSAADHVETGPALGKTLLAWLESGKLPSSRISAILEEYEQLAGEQAIGDLISARHLAARAATAAGDPIAALNFYAKLQSLNPSGEPRFLKPEPLRSVRHDRLIQGEVIDLLSSNDKPTVRQLTQKFDELARQAASSRDPFALQRFTRSWFGLPITTRYLLDDRSQIGLRFGQKLLAMLALEDSRDRTVSLDASHQLIDLYESRSYSQDAISIRRRLLEIAESRSDSEPTPSANDSLWNNGSVTVSEHSEQNLDTTFIPVPVECRPGSLFDRLNVAINPRSSRHETVLRFYGDGISGYWQTVLQTASSPLKSVGRLHRGWGIGHFLVLQLGAELFGISPFDGSGEPRVQRLWSIDMTESNRQEDHRYTPATPGFRTEQLTMLDAFARPLVAVGPVRAGYLCFQTRGKLVCLDTSSGHRLWQRYELPRQVITGGDGQHVFLVQPNDDTVTVLRAIDGATVSEYSLSTATGRSGTILQLSDGQLLTGKRTADSDRRSDRLEITEITSLDLTSATVAWSTRVDREDTVFAIGSHWIGILNQPGDLTIISSRTGQTISSTSLQRPPQIRGIHVTSDASSHIIALSATAESSFLNGRGAGSDLRNPPVTGQLLAVDAWSGELLWQRNVQGIRFLLDQPKNAPCIVLSYKGSGDSENNATGSVLHVLDRRTGKDILNRRSSGNAFDFTIEPHADQNRVSLRMARKSIRLTFSPPQTQ